MDEQQNQRGIVTVQVEARGPAQHVDEFEKRLAKFLEKEMSAADATNMSVSAVTRRVK